MAWVESVRTHLSPLLYNSILSLLITSLSIGVAWGIRPAIKFLLRRFGPPWCGLGATLVQVLILLGGMALIGATAGGNALLVLMAVSIAFFCGLLVGGKRLPKISIAAIRIRSRKLYRRGTTVTLDHEHPDVVQHAAIAPSTPAIALSTAATGAETQAPAPAVDTSQPAMDIAPTGVSEQTASALVGVPVTDMPSADLVNDALPAIATATGETVDLETTAPPADPPRVARRLIRSSHAAPLARRVVLGKRTVKDLR